MTELPELPESAPLRSRALLFVLAAAWLPMLVLSRAEFAFDDRAQLFANAAVQGGDLVLAWTRGWWANVAGASETFVAGGDLWRPLTTTSLLFSHALWGQDPMGYHVENLLLHGAVCALVWRLLLAWRFEARTALLAAMLFALAPIAIEPVASIAQRAELFAALGSALALLALVRERAKLAAAALLFALFSKEGAIVVPLLALLADRCLLGRRDGLRALCFRYAPLVLATCAYLAARYAVLGRLDLGGGERATYFASDEWPLRGWLTQAQMLWSQILPAALIGFPLVFDWSRAALPTAAASSAFAWIALAAAVVLALAAIAFAWRRPREGFAPLWFAVAYLPTANLLLPIGVLFAPRLLYWPHLGSALALALLGREIAMRWRLDARVRIASTAIVLALLGARTYERAALWRSAEALYADTLRAVPENALVRVLHAEELARRAEESTTGAELRRTLFARALVDVEVALRIDPHRLGRDAALLLRCAFGAEQEARAVHAFDAALRGLGPVRPLPPLPTPSALLREPLEESAALELRAWGRAAADLVPASGDLALIGFAATTLPDYLDARAMRNPVSSMLDDRATARARWTNQKELLLFSAGNEMRLVLLRLKRVVETLRPVADAEARRRLLDPMHARAEAWLAALEAARSG